MRKLNNKQKKMVALFCIQYDKDNTTINLNEKYNDLINELEKINCYENLESDVDRLINDLRFTDDIEKTLKNFL